MKAARRKALDDSFQSEDLTGAHLCISLNMAPDVVLSVPIIPPGHTAMLSLAGLIDEVYRDDDGQLKTRRYTNLGVAYDHRVINGSQAMDFLQSIKRRMQSPEMLSWLA